MGAGASAQSGIFGPPDGTLDPEAEWRSENVRQLDRLGGNQRPAIKRGDSTKYRLEWLKEALLEQSDRIEQALAKDPLAGRHEIMRQEAVKLARSMNANHYRFTVREWQTMKHTDLRALQAREELDRRLRERDKSRVADQDRAGLRPPWNLHWSQIEYRGSGTKLQSAHQSQLAGPSPMSPSAGKTTNSNSSMQPGTATEEDVVVEEAETVPEEGSSSLSQVPVPVPAGLLGAMTTSHTKSWEGTVATPRAVRPLTANRVTEPPAEWRLRIMRAKRKAMMIISVVLAFRGRKHRVRGLQRLESLSYFIAQHLGPDLQRFTEEQAMYRVTRATAADLKALAEEVWRDHNYRDHQMAFPDGNILLTGADGTVGGTGDAVPTVTFVGPSNRLHGSGPASPVGAGGGRAGAGTFKLQQQQQQLLRLTPGLASGLSAGASNSGRAGSPLLRSRPTNLTPTLYHHGPQPGISSALGMPAGPSSGGASGIASQRNNPISSASCGGAGGGGGGGGGSGSGSVSGSCNGGAATSAALSRPIPVHHGLYSGRISMPSGLVLPPPLEAESSAGVVVVGGSNKGSARFSAPICDLQEDDAATVSTGDSMAPVAASIAPVAAIILPPPPPPPPPASSGSSKRWMSPRFARRLTGSYGIEGADFVTPPSRPQLGHVTASGAVVNRHGQAALRADDMSTVARTLSWAGPSPLQPLVNGGGGRGGGASSVGHARGIGYDNVQLSPSARGGIGGAGGAVLPAPPPMPSSMSRNPRKRRDSVFVQAGGSPMSPMQPHPQIMRSQTATADGCISSSAATSMAAASIQARYNRRGAGVTRSGSAVSPSLVAGSSGGGGAGGSSIAGTRRRPNRVGGGATGEPGHVSLQPTSPYTDRHGNAAARQALRSSSSVQRMVRDGSSDQLYLRYQEEAAALERPLRMMHLFANRANARWVEELAGGAPPISESSSSTSLSGLSGSGDGGGGGGGGVGSISSINSTTVSTGWETPHVYDATRFSTTVGAGQASVFRAEVATAFRAGRIAVQLLAVDENIVLGDGRTQPLWTADPWDLIATAYPGKAAAAAERLRNVHMGPRLLMALVTAVEALAGPEAVARLVVVMHISDTQQADVVRELRFRKFCGLHPKNLILVVQQRRSGYYWDPEQTAFVRDETVPPASVGSGYAIMQLVWPGEAVQILPDESKSISTAEVPSWANVGGAAASAASAGAAAAAPPPLVPLSVSVLEYLAQHGVEWLMTRRLRDISLYNPDLTLDPEVISYVLFLHEHVGANIAVQVEMAESLTAARAAQTGIVLAPPRARRTNNNGSTSPSTAARYIGPTAMPRRAGTFAASSTTTARANIGGCGGAAPMRVGSDVSSVSSIPESTVGDGGSGGSLHPHLVFDIKNSDTLTPRVIQMLTDIRVRSKGKLAVSTRRYLWRIDMLRSLMQRPSIFHPCLEVTGDHVYLSFDMADLTTATDCGSRCVAVSSGAPRPARSLNNASDLEDLFGAVMAQDAYAPFRRLAGNISPVYGPAHGATNPRKPMIPVTLHPAVTGNGGSSSNGRCARGTDDDQHQPDAAASASAGTGSSHPGPNVDIRNVTAGQLIVVLIADNESTTMAVQLLMALVKPGRDRVVLVTVVPSVLQEASGRMLLRKHEMSLMRTMVEVTTELLTKTQSGSLIAQLESFIEDLEPQLVVMGSQVLATGAGFTQGGHSPLSSGAGGMGMGFGMSFGGGSGSSLAAIYGGGGSSGSLSNTTGPTGLGSVAVSLLRNSTRPMLIVKANAKFSSVAWDKDNLRVLLEVHHSSRNLLRYVCSKLLLAPRHDKIFLTRGGSKDVAQQETTTSRRLLENFADIATQYKVEVVKRPLEEPFDSGAIKWAEHDKSHIIAIHAASGRGISNATLQILRAARSAVLVYKSNE